MSIDKFVNLHGHSYFSLLDGMTRPNELVDYTLKIDQPASCITDHGVMYSIVDHFQYAESREQKAIAGFEAYVVNNHLIKDKNEAKAETEVKREHLVLLAKDNDGYKRITKMCSIGATEGFYYRPRIDDNIIRDVGTNGVIGLSACLAGRIAQNIIKDRIDEAEKWAIHYSKLFNGDFYLELQPTIDQEQIKVNLGLIELHKKLGIPVVATSDYHYLTRDDHKSHDVLLAIQSRSLLSDPNRWKFPGDTFFVMTREEMASLFKQNGHEVLDQKVIEQALDNTVEIANQCNVSFNWGKHYLPKIDPPHDNNEFNNWSKNRVSDGSPSSDYLKYLCIKGLKEKGKSSNEYRKRLDFELKIINEMEFPDYFLIFEDIMRFCRENDVPYGPGRGSAGGSLVAYATGITKVDPLKYDLLFERFLNPQRSVLPDIDADFCVKKGWMVFQYLIDKYGKDYTCNIATFGRLQLKAVIKDVAKALGVPFDEVNDFTKGIPDDVTNIQELKDKPECLNFIKKYPQIFEHAVRLEGAPRHVSQHPAGICVSPIPITDLLPVQNAKETQENVEPGFLSQFEKDQSEQCGVVKLDILKLKNITEIREQIKAINTIYNVDINEESIPFDDNKTWETIGKGDTLGIFQMASNVAIPVLKKVKPKNIEELSAVNAFIRPGASGLEEYLAGKEDPSKIRKLDPRLDRHLEKTYGAIVYQEQIMFLISELMGISFGEADLYRRALEKPKGKNLEIVEKFNNDVVKIAVKLGFDAKVAELVKNLILDNIGYGFNKSHSIAYSIISYCTAYIKTNYPLAFYTTMFNGNLGELSAFMEEAKKRGITINPPHVCYSEFDSIIEDEEKRVIRIGLNAVKGFGPAAVKSIIKSQPFTSINDFFERNNLRSVNKRVIEAGIKANVFSGLGIEIKDSDIPKDIKQHFTINDVDGKLYVYLTRNQMRYWYEKFNEIKSVKSIPNYAVPISMIKGKYFDKYELAVEPEDTIIVPEDRLKDFELKLEDVKQLRTRKRPKAFLKLTRDNEIKASPFRKPIILFNREICEIEEDCLETYLNEIEEFGYSFLTHPLEKYADKIELYDNIQDGNPMMTVGIITNITRRKTKTNKDYYWVIVQTPRDKVRVTLWDNQYKACHKIIELNNMIKVAGIKGYGGINMKKIAKIQ